MNYKVIPVACLLLAVTVGIPSACAQGNNYAQTNLVSNIPGLALTVDDQLVHPWGMAASAGQPYRIAANGIGQFRSYNAAGAPQDPRGVIAVPEGVTIPANPTGVAANTTGLFVPPGSLSSPFLFATRQGTISGEYADDRGDIKTTTILVVDHGSQGAEYTGLAVLTPDCCAPYLAVIDFHRGFVETFTAFFDPLGIPGAFIDPELPAGYAPWNVSVAGDRVFVTYALQDSAQHDPVIGPGKGVVDIYNLDGSFVRRFASNGALNVPSGIVQAGGNFGAFSNDILIGNFGDGFINAFDPDTGQFLGSLKDGNGNAIVNSQLHSMIFADGNAGETGSLYITSAGAGGNNGVFSVIAVNTTGVGPDFSLSASSSSVTVSPGQSATFSVTAAPIARFRGVFSFSCNVPAGATCTVGSPSVDPATGSATVTATVAASPGAHPSAMAAFFFPGILLAAVGIRKRRLCGFLFPGTAIGLLVVLLAGITGCGSSGGSINVRPPSPQTLIITATAGAVSHSTTLTLSVQ